MSLEAFLSDLHKVLWDSSYVYDNIDDIWSHWSSLYEQVVDIHAPLKSIRLRSSQFPWINFNIQKQIRVRNRLYKKYRRFPTDENWSNYRIQRNVVTNLKRKSLKQFCNDAVSSTTTSNAQFWKLMKPLIPNKSGSSVNDNLNIHLIENGEVVPDPSVVFNKFFAQPRIEKKAYSYQWKISLSILVLPPSKTNTMI